MMRHMQTQVQNNENMIYLNGFVLGLSQFLLSHELFTCQYQCKLFLTDFISSTFYFLQCINPVSSRHQPCNQQCRVQWMSGLSTSNLKSKSLNLYVKDADWMALGLYSSSTHQVSFYLSPSPFHVRVKETILCATFRPSRCSTPLKNIIWTIHRPGQCVICSSVSEGKMETSLPDRL